MAHWCMIDGPSVRSSASRVGSICKHKCIRGSRLTRSVTPLTHPPYLGFFQPVVAQMQAVRHIAVMVSSTGEGGLQAVQSSHVRLQDASSATPAQQQSLGWLCISGMPAPKSPSILLCKLHKVSPPVILMQQQGWLGLSSSTAGHNQA